MKPARLTLPILLISILALPIFGQIRVPRPSPKATVSQTIGLTEVTIVYSRPGVKGRTIWGELVPYDKVWRTGANEATSVAFSTDVKVEGQPLSAGTYSLHTIPSKDDWTVIINRVADQWGSYSYDVTKDVLRVKVRPQMGESNEMLTFSFPAVSAESATLLLSWERLRLPINIAVDTRAMTMAGLRESVAKAKPDDWRIPMQAAQYALNGGADVEQGKKWLEQSIAISPTYRNMTVKAEMLARNGDRGAAIAAAEKAIALGKASKEKVDTTGTEALLAKWKSMK